MAEAYLKLGQAEEAKKIAARLDKVSGADYRTALGLGVLLARYRMYPEAIQHFQMALKADPASNEARYNLANAYYQVGDYRRALEFLEQLPEQSRKDDTTLSLLGDLYARLGRGPEAARTFQQAISQSPDKDPNYLSLALIQLSSGEISAAEATLRQGLARTRNSGKLLWGMGILSVVQGRNDPAEEYFKKCTDLIPEWPTSHAALGIFYYVTGQVGKVKETLNRYQELSPGGGLNVKRIQEILANTPVSEDQSSEPKPLSLESRRQFLQLAFALLEQES